MTARRRTPGSGSGKSESLRSSHAGLRCTRRSGCRASGGYRRVDSQFSLSEARSMTGLPLPSGSRYEFRIHPAISETDRTVSSPDYQTDCDRARAEEGTQTPTLPRTPSRLRRAPQRFSQSELQWRHEHSLWVAVGCAVADGWGALVLSIGKARSIVVTEPIQLRSDFTRLRALPPNTLTSSYYFRHSNKDSAKNKFAGSQVQWKGCFAFVLLRMMQTGEEPVKVSLRLASLDL